MSAPRISPVVATGLSFLVLLTLNLHSLVSEGWLCSLPKPVGDGPDYENIAFHLWQGDGFWFDNSDRRWRESYVRAGEDYTQILLAEQRSLAAVGRPPLYPAIIALIYSVTGRNTWGFAGVHIFSACCLAAAGALSVWLAIHLLRNVVHSYVALIGGASVLVLIATHRTLRSYQTDFLTEPLALFLMQLFVVLVIAWCKTSTIAKASSANKLPICFCPHPTPSPLFSLREAGRGNLEPVTYLRTRPKQTDADGWKPIDRWHGLRSEQPWVLSTAGLIALMVFTRSVFVLWLPAIAVLLFMSLRGRLPSAKLRSAVVLQVMLCSMFLCLPWWIHNVVRLRAIMPLGTQGPISLVGGYSIDAYENGGDWCFAPEHRLRKTLSVDPTFRSLANDTSRERQVAVAASMQVKSWLKENWDLMPHLIWLRIKTHWNPYSGRSLIWKILVLIGAAWCLSNQRRASWWLVGLPIVSTLVTAVLYSTGGRFLVPLYGVLFSLSGVGIAWPIACMLRLDFVRTDPK